MNEELKIGAPYEQRIVDPWLVAQHILASTNALCPLVAVQPGYMHPFTAAKMVTSLGMMYGRRIYLNMIAGGFQNDLRALNDHTPHDDRYRRLTEYTLIIQQLLASDQGVTFEGDYYTVRNLRLQPTLPPELFPEIMISGIDAEVCINDDPYALTFEPAGGLFRIDDMEMAEHIFNPAEAGVGTHNLIYIFQFSADCSPIIFSKMVEVRASGTHPCPSECG